MLVARVVLLRLSKNDCQRWKRVYKVFLFLRVNLKDGDESTKLKMSEGEGKRASPIPVVTHIQCCNSVTNTHCPALQVTPRMLRSPSHESVTTDLSLFSVSSIASANRLVTFKSYTDVHLAGRGPSPKPDFRQIQTSRCVRNCCLTRWLPRRLPVTGASSALVSHT